MSESDATVYIFGDNHTHDRSHVNDRLKSVAPVDAEAIVMEHAHKGDNRPSPSQWVYLKNPIVFIVQHLVGLYQVWRRSGTGRVTKASEESVAEEVAVELGLEIEYTDMSWLHRFREQPWYLSVVSVATFLSLILGWVVSPTISIIAILFAGFVIVRSKIIFRRMREEKMAKDLRDLGENHSVMVYFAGDSHIDPVRKRIEDEFVVISTPESRPVN